LAKVPQRLKINLAGSLILFVLSLPIGKYIISFCYNNAIKHLNVPSIPPYHLVGNIQFDLIGAIVPLMIAGFCLIMVILLLKRSFSIRKYFFALLWPTMIGFILSLPTLVSILEIGKGILNWQMAYQGYVSALVGFMTIHLNMEIMGYIIAFLQKSKVELELTIKNCFVSALISHSIATFSVFLIDSVCIFVISQVHPSATCTFGGSGITDGMLLSGVYSTIFVIIFVVLGCIYVFLARASGKRHTRIDGSLARAKHFLSAVARARQKNRCNSEFNKGLP
jgi:hypothetical protein